MNQPEPASTAEEASRREHERLRYALDNAEDGLWDWSAESNTVFRSARCLTMLGYPPGSVEDTLDGWQALVHPDDRPLQRRAINEHIQGSASYKVEYRLRDASGGWRWVLDRGKVISWSPNGKPLRVVGTHTDITAYKELEQRLRERELLLDEAQRIGQIGSWAMTVASGEVWWSPEMYRLVGWPADQPPPGFEEQSRIYGGDSHARLKAAVQQTLEGGAKGFAVEIELLRLDGERRIAEVQSDVIRDEAGMAQRLVGVVHDVTDERRATEAARWRNKLLNRIAAMGRIGGFDLNIDTGAQQWTDENYRIHDIEPGTPLTVLSLMKHYDDASQARLSRAINRLTAGLSTEETTEVEFTTANDKRIVLRMTAIMEQHDGKPWRITGLTQDITDERAAGERIEQLAHYDTLTGLPNRFLFRQRALEAIRVAHRAQLALGLLFIDLDQFKYVNDTLGHAAGDQLLQEVAGRLKQCLRGSDLIGRQGGDEFMVMLCEMRKPEDAALVAEKIIAAVGAPIALGDIEVRVGCSIGIALLSENSTDLETLMRASDTAMYAAKDSGRNTYQFYNDSFYERVHRRGLLEQELRQAVGRDELFLVYQPTVSLGAEANVVGIEALLRWQRPGGELRSPLEFIPIAEDTGEIIPIGLWVLEEACRQAGAWDAAGLRFSTIAVNVSAVQLRDPLFAERVLGLCKKTGWPPTRLVLELTESALMRDTDTLRTTFAAFEAAGINLSVDDFGTGFSNLLYLHRFPIQQLKIDRSFVSQMLEDLQVGVLTQAIINLGHAMGLTVIAEGVETDVSMRALRNQGCDEVQGYHLTRPLLPAAMEEWVRARD